MPVPGVPRGDRARAPGGPDGPVSARPRSDRVLVLVEGRRRVHRGVLGPLAEQLGRGRPPLRLEVRSDPAGMLRIARSHPRSFDGYAAVVVLTAAAPARRRAARDALGVAERAGTSVPTLVVRTAAPGARRPARVRADPRPDTGYDVLDLAAALPRAEAAGRIAVTVRAMLLRRRPALAPPPRPGVLVQVVALPAPHIDAAALHRLAHIVRMTRDAFEVGVAEVNLLDEHDVTTIASAGGGTGEMARTDSLCDIAAGRPGLTVIPDTRLDPRARGRRSALGAGAIRFYAAHPIASVRGEVIGILCVHDPEPQEPEELDLGLLRDLAMLVEGELMDARRRAG